MLRRWHGDVRNAEGDAVTVDLREPRSIVVEFVERPGLDTLDLVSDFQAYLTSIGQGGALETYDRYGWEWGLGDAQVPVGNGVPDVVELVLLEEVLKDINLDLSIRRGVVHNPVWDAWQENLAYVEATHPAEAASTQRVYAAFLTLGGPSGRVLYEDLSGVTLTGAEPLNASRGRFFEADEDADHDGVDNAGEWNAVEDNLPPSATLEERLSAFSTYALDGTSASATDGDGGGAGSGGDGDPVSDCPEEVQQCLDLVTVKHNGAFIGVPLDSVTITGKGVSLDNAEEEAEALLGSTLHIQAKDMVSTEAGPYWFAQWAAQNTMAAGSHKFEEDFPLVHAGETGISGIFYRNATPKPINGATDQAHLSVSGGQEATDPKSGKVYIVGIEGDEMTITAWVNPNLSNAEDLRIDQITVGNNGIRNHRETASTPIGPIVSATVTSDPEPEVELVISPSGSQGGTAGVGVTHGWEGAYIGSATCEAHVDEETGAVHSTSPVTIMATPSPGWTFTHWTGLPDNAESPFPNVAPRRSWFVTFTPNGSYSPVAHFVESPDYELEVTVDGDGCKGWVEVDKPRKYYADGDEVYLEANPAAGYRLAAWTGDVEAPWNPWVYGDVFSGYNRYNGVLMDGDKSVGVEFEETCGFCFPMESGCSIAYSIWHTEYPDLPAAFPELSGDSIAILSGENSGQNCHGYTLGVSGVVEITVEEFNLTDSDKIHKGLSVVTSEEVKEYFMANGEHPFVIYGDKGDLVPILRGRVVVGYSEVRHSARYPVPGCEGAGTFDCAQSKMGGWRLIRHDMEDITKVPEGAETDYAAYGTKLETGDPTAQN